MPDGDYAHCDGLELPYKEVLMSITGGMGDGINALDLLTKTLLDDVLSEEGKRQLKLTALVDGRCVSPMDVVSFDILDENQKAKIRVLVDKWLNESRSHILQHAYARGIFTEEDKMRIANLAWNNSVC